MKNKLVKKGISLIVLIITIIVIIILAGSIIINISKNNPIKSATEAKFKNDASSYINELHLYETNKYSQFIGDYDITTINSEGSDMKNIITSIKTSDIDKFKIKNGNLVFIGTDSDEIDWARSLGIKIETIPYAKRLNDNVIVGYWENWVSGEEGTPTMRLSDISDYYDIVNITFGYTKTDMQPGEISFSLNEYLSSQLNYSESEFKKDIKKLQNRGTEVLLSIGGSDRTITINNDTQVNNFVTTVSNILNTYEFNGIDLDLEMSSGVNVEYFEKAIRELNAMYKGNILITMNSSLTAMREDDKASNGNNYFYKLSKNLKDILGMVSCRYYNSGTQSGYDFPDPWSREQGHISFITSLATLHMEKIVDQNQLGICVVTSEIAAENSNGLPPAYINPDNVVKALKSLMQGIDPNETYKPFTPPNKYPKMRRSSNMVN